MFPMSLFARARRGARASSLLLGGILAVVGATALVVDARPAAAQDARDFTWEGAIPKGRWLYVRNLNGAVRVERASGATAQVTAEKRVKRGSASDVRIEVRKLSGDDVLICAIWNENTTCDEDGYRTRGNSWNRRSEVSVEFTVRLPEGVKLVSSSVNGGIQIDGATSDVEASTVNGSITASSTGGPVRASTVNGGIHVRMRELGTNDLEFETVNGSIDVVIPAGVNAELDMRTVNGRVSSDFPLTITGRINPRHIRATLGSGGPRLKVATINGSVEIRKQ